MRAEREGIRCGLHEVKYLQCSMDVEVSRKCWLECSTSSLICLLGNELLAQSNAQTHDTRERFLFIHAKVVASELIPHTNTNVVIEERCTGMSLLAPIHALLLEDIGPGRPADPTRSHETNL